MFSTKSKRRLATAAAASAIIATPAVAMATLSQPSETREDRPANLYVIGLAGEGKKLVGFSTLSPRSIRSNVNVSGLTGGDTKLIGIDYRVQDGALYGVGNSRVGAGIYKLDPSTGAATLFTRLTAELNGTNFGVDFNPAANALRIISDTGQNLRQPMAVVPTATAVDVTLTNAPATTPATGVNGAAYTNNDADALSGTTLFDLDTALDQISIQSSANSGVLVPTGKLGVDATGDAGFDVHSTIRGGTTVANTALAVLDQGIYEVNLLTGKARWRGQIGASVTDIAILLNQL